MWKRVLVGALALAAACDAFSFAPAGPLATTSAAARRVGVLPQTRPAGRLATSRTQGLRSVKAMAIPPVLGLGFKSLNKRLVVITGTSSGLGLSTLKALLRRGDSFVVCAVRDTAKMKKIVEEEGLDSSALAVLELDLGSFQSVRDFVFNLKVASVRTSRPLASSRAVFVCCTPCTVDVGTAGGLLQGAMTCVGEHYDGVDHNQPRGRCAVEVYPNRRTPSSVVASSSARRGSR
jgi:hypothetical protein